MPSPTPKHPHPNLNITLVLSPVWGHPSLSSMPYPRTNPPAQIFPYPKHISSLTPFPSPTPIPSPASFYPQHSPTQTHPPPELNSNPILQSTPTHLKLSPASLPSTNSSHPILSRTASMSVYVWLSFVRCITGL